MEVPRHWRLKAQRYRMEGSTCPVCGQPAFPPRLICPNCSRQPALTDAYGNGMFPAPYQTVDVISLKER